MLQLLESWQPPGNVCVCKPAAGYGPLNAGVLTQQEKCCCHLCPVLVCAIHRRESLSFHPVATVLPFPCALVPQTTQAVLCDLESSAPLVQLMQREEATPAVLSLTYTVVIHKCIAVVALLPILHDPISAGTPILQAVIHGIQRGELTRQTHSGYWTRPAAACIASRGEGFWGADPTTRFLCLCWSEVLHSVWSKVQQTQ